MRFCKVVIVVLLWGCSNDRAKLPALFTDVTIESGIQFSNDLTFTERMNPYTYRNFYNGAGVALGDVNNDGLQDIFFAGNQVDNKLYLNQGNFLFRDITREAGVASPGVWSTGVTFADINGDGWLDLYVCKSGDPETPNRHNELFINNGDLTFTESAKEYGLDVTGLSVQAAFFDFDKDGDLDCYLLTNSIKSVGQYDLVMNQREVPDPLGGGNKFFINEEGKFRDYSEEAGIYRSNIGFGLGITLGDFNHDSWTDIFVSNDFFERDYLYINDQRGSFDESLTRYFESISMGSMGADYADLDNDGRPELFVTEMLPDSLSRKKTKTLFESWDKYSLNVARGYHHQVPRNVLQKEVADGIFVEVGRYAGVPATEWSWGALLFDMDNDGRRDVFVANGIYKDLLDRDYLAYSADDAKVRQIIREEKDAIVRLIDMMPSSQYPNYAFRNKGGLRFENVANRWGLDKPMYSSGSAYGDLDNDGDLDLVLNNVHGPAAVFRNETDTSVFRSMTVNLSMEGKNRFAVGSVVTAYAQGKLFSADNFVTRGFQSAVSSTVTLGLGKQVDYLDSLLIRWPDHGYTAVHNVPVNRKLEVAKGSTGVLRLQPILPSSPPHPFTLQKLAADAYRHKGSGLIDFNRDRLLPMGYSNETPDLHKGDLDGDGIEEVYVGGGKGQSGVMLQFVGGSVSPRACGELKLQTQSEQTSGTFLDVDGDGDLDFYMASGGRFYPKTSGVLADQLYLNDGEGTFVQSPNALPFKRFFSTSVARPLDFDRDGDIDLFVGERFDPFAYGIPGSGYILENDGHGIFTDVTAQTAPFLNNIGMITDAVAGDFDGDGWDDLMVVGDWMPIKLLKNNNGQLEDTSLKAGLGKTEGWWHEVARADLNGDKKADFILGNHGRNSFFKPGDRMYVGDFDKNGSIEQIFCTTIDGKYYPVIDRDELLSQLPGLKKSLLFYRDYGRKSIDELLGEERISAAVVREVEMHASILLLSDGEGYKIVELPAEAQFSPVYAILALDVDGDGVQDIIAGGNNYLVKPQFGRYDGSSGWFFKGELTKGHYLLSPGVSLDVKGQVRDIEYIDVKGVRYLLLTKYDDDLEIFKVASDSVSF